MFLQNTIIAVSVVSLSAYFVIAFETAAAQSAIGNQVSFSAVDSMQPGAILRLAQRQVGDSIDDGITDLSRLVRTALTVNPGIRGAQARLDAARKRILPAGLPSDPMLMAGIVNLPLGPMRRRATQHGQPAVSGGPDEMTMRMVGIEQTLPYPGKLSLRRRVAEREADALSAALARSQRQVVRDVKDAYYDLAFTDQALSIVKRNGDVLGGLIKVTEARYAVGVAGQQDVLKARVEATRLAETAVTLTEERRATLARLNSLLDRPTDAPVARPTIPVSVTRAAVASSSDQIRFTSSALGARAADSPFPSVFALQETAVSESPEIRESDAMIAAQVARLELARKDVLPDFDLSLQYGQRGGGLPDMVTALVSVPLPVFKGHKQNQLVSEATAQVDALGAERAQRRNALRAEVARLVSELERSRSQLALYVKALLPQANASLTSAAASYQVSRVEFLTVLDNQATVFNYETEYFRALSDFAKNLAELERVVGKEVIP